MNPVTKGIAYEERMVKLLNAYGLKAFRTNKSNDYDPEQYKAGFDGGIDIIAKFENNQGKVYKDFTFYIQCKCRKSDLTKQAISEVYAGMHARNAKSQNCIPVVFCSCNVSKETRQYAKDLNVELFLREHEEILTKACNGEDVPYNTYGILMKVLLYKATQNNVWLNALPDYQSNVFNMNQLEGLIMTSEMDFNEAQAYIDESNHYEDKAREKRQLALDIQKNAVMRALQVSGTVKQHKEKSEKSSTDLDSG